MIKSTVSFAFVLLATVAVMAAEPPMNAGSLKWAAAPPIFATGAQMSVVSGDPSKAGLYVIRLKMPAKYTIAAHHHPTAEYVTVISGNFHLGMGDKLDKAKGIELRSDGFAEAPPQMNHYAWTTTPTIVQVHGEGPFALTYVNPADDPSKK